MRADGGVRRNPNVVWRRETRGGGREGLLLFNYKTRGIHYLEGLAARLWQECEGRSPEELAALLGLEDRRVELEAFLRDLAARELLEHDKPESMSEARSSQSPGMWGARVFFDAPLFIQYDCTNRCNLRCRHCVTRGGEEVGRELSTEEALSFIEEAGRMGVFQLGFSGGEPLMREDIFTLMEAARKAGMKVQVTTNATLITGEVAERLAEIKPVTVGVSLEAGGKAGYESFRGKGSFERFVEGVKNLVSKGVKVKFKTAVLKSNMGEMDRIISLAQELGAEAVDMFLFYPQGRGERLAREKLDSRETKAFLQHLSRRRRELEGVINIDVDDKPNAFLIDPELSHSTCGAGVYWAEVLPNGDVVPCIFFKDLVTGNVRKSLTAAWRSQLWSAFRDRRRLKGRCGSCPHLTRCGGGCRANGYAETGDLYAEDSLCWYGEAGA